MRVTDLLQQRHYLCEHINNSNDHSAAAPTVLLSQQLDAVHQRSGGRNCLLLLLYPVVQPHHRRIDVDVIASTGHQQVDVVAFRQCSRLMLADLLFLDLCLVGKDEDWDVFHCELPDLLHPNFYGIERTFVGDAVDQ